MGRDNSNVLANFQISGRQMFEFNPDLITGDDDGDDDAEAGVFEREASEDVSEDCTYLNLICKLCKSKYAVSKNIKFWYLVLGFIIKCIVLDYYFKVL